MQVGAKIVFELLVKIEQGGIVDETHQVCFLNYGEFSVIFPTTILLQTNEGWLCLAKFFKNTPRDNFYKMQ